MLATILTYIRHKLMESKLFSIILPYRILNTEKLKWWLNPVK